MIEKSYCSLRKCKSSECRMAGTGNDYIGKVNVTRSNRTCQRWYVPQKLPVNTTELANSTTTVNPNNKNVAVRHADDVQYHHVDSEYLNGSLYAEMSAEIAANFCRNPSRTIAGKKN